MKLELTIPTSISEIPLISYQKFLKMQHASNDEEFIAQKMIENADDYDADVIEVMKELVSSMEAKVK